MQHFNVHGVSPPAAFCVQPCSCASCMCEAARKRLQLGQDVKLSAIVELHVVQYQRAPGEYVFVCFNPNGSVDNVCYPRSKKKRLPC